MEIFDFSKNKFTQQGFMVRVSKKEALSLIKSLSTQLADNNPNSGRLESNAKLINDKASKEVYFSISVNDIS